MVASSLGDTTKCSAQISSLSTQYLNGAVGNPLSGALLTWQVKTDRCQHEQIAYQIESRGPGEEWQSHSEQKSNRSIAVPTHDSLQPYERKEYRVRIETECGWSDFSEPTLVFAGPGQLDAELISIDSTIEGPSPIFRTEFQIQSLPTQAMLSFSGFGVVDIWINGNRVGDAFLSPGWTAYQDRILFETVDVAPLLQVGDNAISAIVSDGWYRGRLGFADKYAIYGNDIGAILQIDALESGNVQRIVETDGSWKAGFGPVQMASIYDGSTIDFSIETGDPSSTGFDDSSWQDVKVLGRYQTLFQPRVDAPVRQIDSFPMLVSTRDDFIRLEAEQNISGWIKLRVKGKAGTTVVVKHAEICHPDGSLFTEALRTALATDTYTLGADGEAVLEPVHTFHGFQFADVIGNVEVLSAEAIAISSDIPTRSELRTGFEPLNQLHSNVYWSQRDNFVSIPTDCPQRDERLGWTGDAQAFAPTASTLLDAEQFWINWMRDLELDQAKDGAVPAVVPNIIGPDDLVMGDGPEDSMGRAGWADAATFVPFAVYESYGSKEILERSLSSMRRWIKYLDNTRDGELLREGRFQFGDWLDPDAPNDRPWQAKVSRDFVANAFYVRSLQLLAKAERLVGDPDITHELEEKAKQLSEAVWKKWRKEAFSTQTGAAMALEFGIAPDAEVDELAASLAENVRNENGRIATGFLGTPLVMFALSNNGFVDEALSMLLRREAPSWLYAVDQGATTIWERWDAIRSDGSLNKGDMDTREGDTMISFNHYAYGAVIDWVYRYVAGIGPTLENPGYRTVLISPKPSREIGNASATVNSRLGPVRISWTLQDTATLDIETQIPFGAVGELDLPLTKSSEITGDIDSETKVLLPGRYRFTITNPQIYRPHKAQ